MSRFYKLDGHRPVQVNHLDADFDRWFSDPKNRRIAVFQPTNKVEVSTVFLSLDHSFTDGAPVLFETMVFGGQLDGYQIRTRTWDQAMNQHFSTCALVCGSIRQRLRKRKKGATGTYHAKRFGIYYDEKTLERLESFSTQEMVDLLKVPPARLAAIGINLTLLCTAMLKRFNLPRDTLVTEFMDTVRRWRAGEPLDIPSPWDTMAAVNQNKGDTYGQPEL